MERYTIFLLFLLQNPRMQIRTMSQQKEYFIPGNRPTSYLSLSHVHCWPSFIGKKAVNKIET